MSDQGMVSVSAAELQRLQKIDAAQKLSGRKAAARIWLLADKAKAAGFKVTKAEIDAKIAADDAKKASEATPAPPA